MHRQSYTRECKHENHQLVEHEIQHIICVMILFRVSSFVLFCSVFLFTWLFVNGLNVKENTIFNQSVQSIHNRCFVREVKYAHYSGGLGNNLYGLVSAYTIAAVLDARLTCMNVMKRM